MYVTDQPRRILRLEGVALLAAALVGVEVTHAAWWLALSALVLPDVSIALYALGARRGALAYNLTHTVTAPAALLALGALTRLLGLDAFALGWIAHVGLDRAVGYGLKYETGFAHTHLGRISASRTRSTTPAGVDEPPRR